MPQPRFLYEKWAAKELPSNPTPKEKDLFIGRETERWQAGYGGLTGYHYFSLTQCKIKDASGKEIRPLWRDVDEDQIYNPYQQAIKQQEDIMYVKRREVGLTSVFGGVVPICNSLIYAGSNNLITSADKDRIKNLFIEKTTTVYDNLDPDIKPSRASTRQEGYMFFAKKDRKTNEYSGLKSSIVCKETVDNPNAFETYRAKSLFIDEFFLHPKATTVRTSGQACLKDGFMKIAPIVMGGSCGVTSVDGMKEARKLWRSSEALGIVTVFIAGNLGIMRAPELDDKGKATGKEFNFCPNGHSDTKRATEWILKTRDKLAKAEDKKPYNVFIKEYPLTIEEVLASSGEGILPPEVMQKVTEQKIYLLNNPNPVNTYDLIRTPTGVVEKVNPNGKFTILEKPQREAQYGSGTDPIPFNTENIKEGSEYSTVIKKLMANVYVAYYSERSLNVDQVVNNAILLQDYYFGAKTMMETNAYGAVLKAYRDLGRLDLLAKKPKALGIQFVDKKESYGYYKNEKTTQRGIELFVKYLINHCDKIFLARILDEISGFPHENTDLLDAIIACEFYDVNLIEIGKKRMNVSTSVRQIQVIERGEDGRTRMVWKTVSS